ncbi:MAG TPA: hypothetical protein VFO25_02975 [Candidatus Eremiobacteraceae bacterium]|nr:hypothetical protein [Candidatus Eremiobacteraceae bacterium]
MPSPGVGAAMAPVHRNIPVHVLTWDNLGGGDGIILNPWSIATPWLTYASTTFGDSAAIAAAQIIPAIYTNPNRQGPGDPMYTDDESTFAHDCSGNRIQSLGVGVGKFLMDPHSSHLAALWHDYARGGFGDGAVFTYIFEDKADTINKTSATPCNFDQTDWTNATNELDRVLGYTIIYNSLGDTAGQNGQPQIAPSIALNASSAGGMSEDCYVTMNSQPYQRGLGWEVKEDTEIDMAAAGKYFVCDASDPSPAIQSDAERIYYLASALLTYDPNTTIFETCFKTAMRLHVLPETQLMPTAPLVAQPTSIDGLYQSGGGYGREYAHCYYAGVDLGACAAFVNPNKPGTKAVPFPWPSKYLHTLELTGGGVLDGGTATPTGAPPPATFGPTTAAIAFP